MSIRMAFIGFQHGHILGLYKLAQQREDIEIVAACEEDAETRATLAAQGVEITHDSYRRMLDETPCDAVACGDWFGIRGQRLIEAMERGLHVIGDKPLCTTLDECERIASLAQESGLRVGCMLDLGDLGPYLKLRELILGGRIGEVHTIQFWGQHPLLYGKRPAWYFEPGRHGGSLNDIAVHAIDIVPWMTGRTITEITAARAWNAKLKQHPCFQDGAALMLALDNGGIVLGDVSYLSSDAHGYGMKPYWRFTISGTDGVVESNCNATYVTLWRHDTPPPIQEPIAPNRPGAYFDAFLADLGGNPLPDALTTSRVLHSTRLALLTQHAADAKAFPLTI
jgi:predicted dehydrogenase